jgi:hypothetical protein
MPEKRTIARAHKDKAAGKSASTQAGEFVRQEMHHIRRGKHGARSSKQAIAIGLSEARRAGVKLKSPGRGSSASTRRKAKQDSKATHKRPSARRARASEKALQREPKAAASHRALSRQTRGAARKRSAASRTASARKAARTRKSRGS